MKPNLLTLKFLIAGTLALLTVDIPSFAADTTTGTTGTTTGPTSTSASSTPTNKLVSQFSTFAGSTDNARSLVTGLRNGSSITLTSSGTTGSTTFTPPTKPMGFGNVNIALALAQASLAKQGITNPTPQQLQAALVGGSVTTSKGTTTLPGILTLRSEGKGWGVIAKSQDLNLGKVVSGTKTEKSEKVAERTQKAERAEKVERPEKMERPEKVERPERVERPEKVERPGR